MLSFFGVIQHNADADWPREIQTDKGKIIIYQPQPEKLTGNILEARAAISIEGNDSKEPSFGAMWIKAKMNTDRGTRTAVLEDLNVTNLRFPAISDSSRKEGLINMIETEMPKWQIEMNLDDVVATLEQNNDSGNKPAFNNNAPEVVVSEKPALLVVLDGSPKMMDYNKQFSKVANTPYFMVKEKSGSKYYLYAQENWYSSNDALSGWSKLDKPSKDLRKLEDDIKKNAAKNADDSNNNTDDQNNAVKDYQIIVKTHPAELIASDGKPNFVPITNTSLLYMNNTNADVFMNIDDNQYYTVLSGRWFKASNTKGPWTYIDPAQLPKDFANIPEGSEKDEVLAYVPGTDASRDALLDSQIPQTATVDRNTAKASDVTYDGSPSFKPVDGTNLQYAQNTSSAVFRSGNTYYLCDNAVWFQSYSPSGPWTVCTSRPPEIDNLPPSNPYYNTKYVYIYDVTPTTIYTGYTPGYLGCYSYGPTVVYGTGWYYPGWYGMYYYPRPITWGFGFSYSPWTGWGFNWGFTWGDPFFSFGFGFGGYGGWWGPPVYHPIYHRPYYYGGGYSSTYYRGGYYGKPYNRPAGGYYGRPNNVVVNNNITVNRYNRNMYSYHTQGVSTRAVNGRMATRDVNNVITRPQSTGGYNNNNRSTLSNGGNVNRPNNVYTDRQGNVYRRSNNNWEVRDGNGWRSQSSQSNTQPGSIVNRPSVMSNNNSRPAMPDNRQQQQPAYSRPATQQQPTQQQQQPAYNRPAIQQPSMSRPSEMQRPQQPSYSRPAQGTIDRSSYDRQRGMERSQNFQQSQQSRSYNSGGGGGGFSRPSGGGGGSRSSGGGGGRHR